MNTSDQKVFVLVDSSLNTHQGTLDLGAFVRDNDLEPEEVNEIGKLEVGEEKAFGGGAAPLFFLRRIA